MVVVTRNCDGYMGVSVSCERSVQDDEKLLETDGGSGCTTRQMYSHVPHMTSGPTNKGPPIQGWC